MQLPRPFGPYMLLRRLAVGGMAEIYVAKTAGLGGFEKLVAIKVVHPHLSADPHFVRMLIDEAKILVLLTHANIAQVFDLGCIDGAYYIAMEFVDGVDVHGLLQAAMRVGQPLPIPVVAHIVAEMLSGLDYAHRRRDANGKSLHIVHRDISPQNVVISHAGEVKLVDFGIAKTNLRGEGTEVGIIKGKYYYMSPEQAWADPMDRRSDIFSTGIVLYEMLTGSMLYSAQSIPELINKVREAQIEPPETRRAEIPQQLSAIVMRALRREPKDRYQSALEMAEALRDFLYDNAPAFNTGRLAHFVSELLERDQRVRTEQPSADDTGGLRALTREEFVRSDNSVLFNLRDLATRDEALPARLRKAPPASGRAHADQERSRASVFPAVDTQKTPAPGFAREASVAPPRPRISRPPPPGHPLEPRVQGDFGSHADRANSLGGTPQRISVWPHDEHASEPPDEPTELWTNPLQHGTGDETIVDSRAALGFVNGTEGTPNAPFDDSGTTNRYLVDDAPPAPPALRPGQIRTVSWPAPSLTPPSVAGFAPQGTPALVPPPGHGAQLAPIPPSPPMPDFGSQDRWPMGASRYTSWRLLGVAVAFAILGVLAFQFTRTQQPEPTLEIVSVPNGARVRVDGRVQNGLTPLRITGLEAGRSYDLYVELKGYVPWAATYHASPGAVQHIAVLKPETGELHVVSEPTGSDVWLDGVPIGKTPLTVSSIAAGRRLRLRVAQRGYVEARRDVVVDEQQLRAVVKFALAREPR